MTSELKPFLNADSIGKEYKRRDGKTGHVLWKFTDGTFLVASDCVSWRVYATGHLWLSETDKHGYDLLPPAPPEPERRTVWLCIRDYDVIAWNFESSAFCDPSSRQGEAVPVNLERGADGNWSVVAKKTAKELAADAMYEALKLCDEYLRKCYGSASDANPYPALAAALAKAEGRE